MGYIDPMKNCENCDNTHDGTFASGRFCSSKCSRSFSTKHKRSEINEKISLALTGKNLVPSEKRSEALRERWKNLDDDARNKFRERFAQSARDRWKDEEYRKKMQDVYYASVEQRTEIIRKKVLEGTWHGWSTFSKTSSYAEAYFEKFFDELCLSYTREQKIGKYFVDFLFPEKIVLEIDGKQHEIRENHVRDLQKDEYLSSQGYRIFRIKWKNVNREEGRKDVHKQTQDFLRWLVSSE